MAEMIAADSVRHAESTNLMRSMPQRMVRTKELMMPSHDFLGETAGLKGREMKRRPTRTPQR